ncbi:hypothetical protein AMTR_s00005p00029740 [Amborella trichopoda]|uniref:Uncharacterized protein n=1 Tax=Amborella trichopoda TaxID=13333 RepID=W1PI09_AMBTC|nr:hypothetical protein AMTR_s00005p00029740 [Amborella trichopoda]
MIMDDEGAQAESDRKNRELVMNVTTVGRFSTTRDQSNVQWQMGYVKGTVLEREGCNVKGTATIVKAAAPTVTSRGQQLFL